MNRAIEASEPDGVEATVEYVSPRAQHSLRYLGSGQEVNTASFDQHKVYIRNARRTSSPPTLATTGFELVRHSNTVDLHDDHAEGPYRQVIERLLVEHTGAEKAVVFGPRRRHTSIVSNGTLPGATDVHVDYAAADSRRIAARLLGLANPAEIPYRRYMAINLWRALSAPPQDRPLAICDGTSVATQSGAYNTLMPVDNMPPREQMLTEPPADPNLRRGFLFHYDPAHRWFYFPNMRRDELLLFKLYDSTETGPWRCPHVSFVDPTVKNAPPRESYEIRSFVFFS